MPQPLRAVDGSRSDEAFPTVTGGDSTNTLCGVMRVLATDGCPGACEVASSAVKIGPRWCRNPSSDGRKLSSSPLATSITNAEYSLTQGFIVLLRFAALDDEGIRRKSAISDTTGAHGDSA